ncbi:outer membrane protein [Mesorhizobium sp. CO1-1-8]|uniref:outer membrane protein n=1 Tax=Mesorhizobium sp. CO1-1-8 TaxID=2876631 RepID=UPI001CD1052C|nr:outer membrane protein [Mesorhizobium sp. CO1-1-8]MBZ9774306.1 porin family protein [Mesorhizobium sp. CO1-1-8]
MRIFAISAGLVLSAGFWPAHAASPDMPAAPPIGFNWTGGYGGVLAGYAWGDGRFTGDDDHANPKPAGLMGGLYVGANHQFGNNVVLGIDADIAWSGADDDALVYNSAGVPWPADYPVVQEISRTGAIRARLGYATDRWLPYIAGGVAFADVNQRLVGADDDFDTTYTGWTLGVGTEYAFTDNMILRAEYRHADFGSKTFDLQDAPPLDIELKTHEVRIGIAYKF